MTARPARQHSASPASLGELGTLESAYRGKRVLITGATGFLGGVTLSLLLSRVRDASRVYVLVRKAPGLPAALRFADRVLPSVAFDPIRDAWSAIGEQVTVLQGDLSAPDLGFDEATLAELEGLDLIINCAGLVDFNAPLDQAHKTNILGVRHLIAVARRTGAFVVHVSTCFVAGSAIGRRAEEVASGFFPRSVDSPYLDFDPEREVADLEAEIARLGAAADEQAAQARYREQALDKALKAGGALPSGQGLANAARRLQRDDLRATLVDSGQRRAKFWGWPNVYTYSKSIGEQLLAVSGVPFAIVRPAIIESALAYPVQGYNQNATTSAPLVMLALAGFQIAPAQDDLVIDIVPVDAVASAILSVGAAALAGRAETVYQVSSSESNPCKMERVLELIGLYIHLKRLREGSQPIVDLFKANREPRSVGREAFEARTKGIEALWKRVGCEVRQLETRFTDTRVREILDRVATHAERISDDLDKARTLWELFLPFSHDYDYRFVSARIRALWADLGEEEAISGLDWQHYWIDVHIPGLEEHVLTEGFGKTIKAVGVTPPLLERIEGVARHDPHRSAITWAIGPQALTVSYGELWRRGGSVAAALAPRAAAEIAVHRDAEGFWLIGLIGALRAGRSVRLTAGNGLQVEADGFTWARKKRAFEVGRLDEPVLGPSEVGATGEVRLEGGPAVAPRVLADRMNRLAGWLGLSRDRSGSVEGSVQVTPGLSGADLAMLAVLHAQAELVVGDLGNSTGLIAGATLGESALQVVRVLDLAPEAGMARLAPYLDERAEVVQVLLDGLSIAAYRMISQAEHRSRPFKAEKGIAWSETPWLVRLDDRQPENVVLEGVRETAPMASLCARLEDDPGVDRAMVFSVDGVRTALVRPDLGHFQDFRNLLAHLRALMREVNLTLPIPSRLSGLVVTLGPAEASDWESGTDWVRLGGRDGDRDDTAPPKGTEWAQVPDDQIPLDDLEEETLRLVRGRISAPNMDFVWDSYREKPATYRRLLLLERVLIRNLAKDAPFNAQAFLQHFERDEARIAGLDYRAAYRVGILVRKWQDWHKSDDPEGLLLPEALTDPVKLGVGEAINTFFRVAMDVDLRGKAYLPADTNFLVAANHSSHLDIGVIKHALGPWGNRVHALAAKDYFFGTPAMRFVSHHFTRLIPTERQAITTGWIKRAKAALASGDCVLIFPEGTRTSTPEVGTFKASLGTLLRSCKVPVLPVYIHGTHEILPKGVVFPKGRKITVHLGPLITYAALERHVGDAGALARDRMMAAYVEEAVRSLPNGRPFWLEQAASIGSAGSPGTNQEPPPGRNRA